jgi:hypothetical protein
MHKTVRLKNKVQGDIDCGPDLQVLILLSEMRAIFNRARQVRGQSKNLTSPSRTVENYEKDSPQRPTTSQAGAIREAHRLQELIRFTGRNMSALWKHFEIHAVRDDSANSVSLSPFHIQDCRPHRPQRPGQVRELRKSLPGGPTSVSFLISLSTILAIAEVDRHGPVEYVLNSFLAPFDSFSTFSLVTF